MYAYQVVLTFFSTLDINHRPSASAFTLGALSQALDALCSELHLCGMENVRTLRHCRGLYSFAQVRQL